MKFNESFFDTEEVDEQEARERKEELLKKKLELSDDTDIDLGGVSDEDLDKALNLDDETKKNLVNVALEGITESVDEVIDCMQAVDSSEEDIVEALHVHIGLKLEEAQEIYQDRIQEKREKTLIDRLYESLNLAQKIDKEDAEDAGLDFEPAKPEEASFDKDGVNDPSKSLENQKGEQIGKAPNFKKVVDSIEKPVLSEPESIREDK